MQSLKLENRRLNEKLNERKNKDAKVVTESQTSNMDVDNTQDDKIQQLEVLKRMKQSGFNRSSPQNSPMKKQTQNINCETCGVQFDTRENFEKHNHTRLKKKQQTSFSNDRRRLRSRMRKS